jgi:hydroxyacylglutathione hydrolase
MRSLHAHIDVYGGAIDRPKGTTKFAINRHTFISLLFRYIRDGDDIHVGSLHFSAHLVPGHTRGHLIYRLYTESTIPESVFTGDLLFIGGMGKFIGIKYYLLHQIFIGKVFECSMADMLQSLDSLDQFDSDTLIWPGHEYSLENLRFACHIEPDNDAAVEKRAAVLALRQQRMPTVNVFFAQMARRLK